MYICGGPQGPWSNAMYRCGGHQGHFNKELSCIPHIDYLKAKCLKALKILLVVARTDSEADQYTFLQSYGLLVRSKLHYGCFIYGSAM